MVQRLVEDERVAGLHWAPAGNVLSPRQAAAGVHGQLTQG
jgi:hypothetical protein